MNEELLVKLLVELELINKRLTNLEESSVAQFHNVHAKLDTLALDQQEEVIITLQRIDAKMAAILETHKLNIEILRVFSSDLVQH
jgi:hypothetical protein